MSVLPEELTFLKMLAKYNSLNGLEAPSEALELVCWSLQELKLLEYVLSLLKEKFEFEMTSYGSDMSPMWKAIRLNRMSLEKVKMMIPFATKKFWNSSKKFSTHSVNHSPLADAIMVGNFEMVKAIMPYTKIKANPKRRFGSYLHVAVKYGQSESFKFIVQEMKKE